MGYPVSVEERTVEKEQLVMHDEMKTMVGWNQMVQTLTKVKTQEL